jgi:hypothetical protein
MGKPRLLSRGFYVENIEARNYLSVVSESLGLLGGIGLLILPVMPDPVVAGDVDTGGLDAMGAFAL